MIQYSQAACCYPRRAAFPRVAGVAVVVLLVVSLVGTTRTVGAWALSHARIISNHRKPSSRRTSPSSLSQAPSKEHARALVSRRTALVVATATASLSLVGFTVTATQAAVPQHYITLTLTSPEDRVGLELYDVRIGAPARPVVAIRRVLSDTAPAGLLLLPGMVNRDYSSAAALTARVKAGPFPLQLVFENLALGGDALAGDGTPLVTAADALHLAQELAEEDSKEEAAPSMPAASSSYPESYSITILQRPSTPSSTIQSRRGDVLEINYQARLGGPTGTIYDASENRGTGQPYQMVLGSGDIMNGVDQGLYDMVVGEVRVLQIPPQLAYGRKGNKMFHIPPDATLYWQVELVAINSLRAGDARSRDEIEERVPYE